ncbi:MAG TPA: glycosyltransferase [Thermoanaerobaculia bacterium]|nr:glycosyltransferase [Thermoanaerobaculia bacterium]
MKSNDKDASRRTPVPIPAKIKDAIRDWPGVRQGWTAFRREQMLGEYRRRRERYRRLAEERGVTYREDAVAANIRARLAQRGYTPLPRARGEVHTFACFPLWSWHKHLLPDLHELGPVTHFDYHALGYEYDRFIRQDAEAVRSLEEMSAGILPALREAHARRPVDWCFFYGGGQDIVPAIVRAITEELGIPVANMSLDDKQGWAGVSPRGWRTGAVDITSVFDLYATSARIACEWHLLEGGRPVYMPEGFDASAYAPRDVRPDLEVSFVGAAYGFRTSVVAELRRYGVSITTFGSGWANSRWTDDIVDVFNRSRINLGMGGIEYSESLTNVKGRDFEIPGTGGGMYLTSYNPDLAQHFVIGEEIVCYRNRDEMLELIRWYLEHPDEARAIAESARARSLREHRWLHRYEKMLRIFGVLQ